MTRARRTLTGTDEQLAARCIRLGFGKSRAERVQIEAATLNVFPWRTPSYNMSTCPTAQYWRKLFEAIDAGYFPEDDSLQPRVLRER